MTPRLEVPVPLKTTEGEMTTAALEKAVFQCLPLAQPKLTPCGPPGSCALEKAPPALLRFAVRAPELLGLGLTFGLNYMCCTDLPAGMTISLLGWPHGAGLPEKAEGVKRETAI